MRGKNEKKEIFWQIGDQAAREIDIFELAHNKVLWRELQHPLEIQILLQKLQKIWKITHAWLDGITRINLFVYGTHMTKDQFSAIKKMILELTFKKNKIINFSDRHNTLTINSRTSEGIPSSSFISFAHPYPYRLIIFDGNLFGADEIYKNAEFLTRK